jgi:hypothetical protein
MAMKQIAIVFLIFVTCPGCDWQKREIDLQKKQAALHQKEKQLNAKEKFLNQREQDLLKREQALDSLHRKDSTHLDSTIQGRWLVTMTCTSSTCAGSAVGDVKSEQWDISFEGGQIIAKSITNEKVTRIYTGSNTGDFIELEEQQNTSLTTKMLVRLHQVNTTTMEGERDINREDCKVVYALQLEKL